MVSPQLTESSHFIAMIKTDFNDSIKNMNDNDITAVMLNNVKIFELTQYYIKNTERFNFVT